MMAGMKAFKARCAHALLLFFLVLSPLAAAASPGRILVYGDSLSASYGIGQQEGWVALLQERLRKSGLDYTVANASISGETTSGGATRIAQTLSREKPRVVIVELGANDGLRGLPVAQMKDNLNKIVRAAKSAGSRVLLVGMKMPPNYGPAYTREYEEAFRQLAREHKLALVPHFLEGIAERRELFQADQLHPTAQAQPILLEAVWKELRPLL
jgi:acyl-CoA thioesterase I